MDKVFECKICGSQKPADELTLVKGEGRFDPPRIICLEGHFSGVGKVPSQDIEDVYAGRIPFKYQPPQKKKKTSTELVTI
jgi:hypothetical protein